MNEQTWRKSSHSGSGGGSCAEIGTDRNMVVVRDTKQAHMGAERTVLGFTAESWRAFTQQVRNS